MKFETFGDIVSSLEEDLPSLADGKKKLFLPSNKMDIRCFKYVAILSSGIVVR
jgi:hypothetical protein